MTKKKRKLMSKQEKLGRLVMYLKSKIKKHPKLKIYWSKDYIRLEGEDGEEEPIY